MSIIDAYNTSEPIISPEQIKSPVEGFPQTVLAVFSQAVLEAAAARFKLEKIAAVKCIYTVPIYTLEYKGRTLGLYMSCLGGSAAAGTLEEIYAMGARRVLFFGSCGVLDKEIAAGHFVIPNEAYRDEGTSYHYMPASDYLTIESAAELASAFDAIAVPYTMGKTWTTDAIYRETRQGMEARRREGCITVEMECASIMAVAQFRKKAAYQFLYAEDCLDGIKWDPRIMDRTPTSSYDAYLSVGLECAIRLKG